VFTKVSNTITIKADYVDSGSITTSGTITLANGATTGTATLTGSNGSSALLVLTGLTSSSVYVKTNTGTKHDYQTGITGTYTTVIPFGSTGTWTWAVKRLGYRHAIGNFSPASGGTISNSPATPQKLNPDGTPMYTGTTTVYVDIVFNGSTQANIDIGNGTAPLQATFDMTEDALITEDGMYWLVNGKSDCSQFNSAGGDYLFMSTGWRLRRASA